MKKTRVDIDRVFHALGDGTRRAMLDRLREGPASVSRLAEPLGITLTAVGQHLEILEKCGLAVTEKVGRVRTCRIGSAGLDALEKWVREHRTEWERRIDRLGELLDERELGHGRKIVLGGVRAGSTKSGGQDITRERFGPLALRAKGAGGNLFRRTTTRFKGGRW
jgi:DNA-binding transcriptional ArsR family regulator